jgi:hypothetical protein
MNKEHLIEIYKVEAEKYNKTRDIQWKMNVAFWTVLIVGIYSKSKEGFKLQEELYVGLLYVLLHLLFVVQIQASLGRSITRLRHCGDYILEGVTTKIIGVRELEIPLNRSFKEVGRDILWHVFQIGITIFLVFIFDAMPEVVK